MSLTFDTMLTVANEIVVRPGWHLRLEMVGDQLRLNVETDKIPNTRWREDRTDDEKREIQLFRREYKPMSDFEDANQFRDWIIFEYLWLILHEELEQVRWRSTHEPVLDPHAATTTITGLLPPRPGEPWDNVHRLMIEAQRVIDTEYREDIDFRPLQAALDYLSE